ncbi:hypothetical protein E2320_022396 [Naja naja]|nr:hypothetical protein E2320_022396 [Naja naja]
MEDIACQLGACLKSQTEWSGSTSIQRMEGDLLGQATLPNPLIDRLKGATILEWRAATGPTGLRGDHNEPAEWQYQTVVCSETFEDLLDQLEQLVIGCEGRGRQRRQILPQRDQEGDLPLQETFHLHIVRLREWNAEGQRMGSGTNSNEASPTSPTTTSSACKCPNTF